MQGAEGLQNTLAENAKGYAALLRGHIQKEDEILYPLAERVLPENVRPRIREAYEKATDPDVEARYVALVEKYEQDVD